MILPWIIDYGLIIHIVCECLSIFDQYLLLFSCLYPLYLWNSWIKLWFIVTIVWLVMSLKSAGLNGCSSATLLPGCTYPAFFELQLLLLCCLFMIYEEGRRLYTLFQYLWIVKNRNQVCGWMGETPVTHAVVVQWDTGDSLVWYPRLSPYLAPSLRFHVLSNDIYSICAVMPYMCCTFTTSINWTRRK